MPAVQFGAKPYSRPTPITPPQRVRSACAMPMPGAVSQISNAGCDGSAALYIKQRCVPGVTNLPRDEEPQAIDVGFPGVRRVEQANALISEMGPIALGFQSKHPSARLPAIADLTTNDTAAGIIATFSEAESNP